MKTTLTLLLLLLLGACNNSQDPGNWFNTINDAEDRSRKAFSAIGKKMENQQYLLTEALEEASKENQIGVEVIATLPPLENGEKYRQAVLLIMADYDSFFTARIPNYLRLVTDSLPDEEAAKIQTDFESALQMHQTLEENIIKEQDAYFNNFKLNAK